MGSQQKSLSPRYLVCVITLSLPQHPPPTPQPHPYTRFKPSQSLSVSDIKRGDIFHGVLPGCAWLGTTRFCWQPHVSISNHTFPLATTRFHAATSSHKGSRSRPVFIPLGRQIRRKKILVLFMYSMIRNKLLFIIGVRTSLNLKHRGLQIILIFSSRNGKSEDSQALM